ncbi:MAG: PKD domain-containing protein [Flavobacteriales bacterium]|nr:PKD domain-containing protein [Flavobacteriales bacterium]MCB9204265.1 PKD domain-containing protein [Flavobacteriales bacterium]
MKESLIKTVDCSRRVLRFWSIVSAILCVGHFSVVAQLSAGDIAFVQYNADGTDDFAFVALVDIPGSEVIFFTDNEPSGSGINSGEGIIEWTAPAGGVSCGSVVFITTAPAASVGTVSETLDLNFSGSGDGLWAYQGSTSSATFIAALGNDDPSGSITTANEGSITGTGLTVGSTAFAPTEVDNLAYTGTLSGTPAALRTALCDDSNWTTDNSATQTFSGTFSVTGCTAPSNCSGQMSGTYTINSAAAASCTNYQDFASAISDMVSGFRTDDNDYRHDGGISGAVVFEVATGTYTEQVSIAEVSGASGTNTITFRSASGTNTDVTLQFASSTNIGDPNYVFQFNGADYVSLEDMTIERTGTNVYGRVIDFTGDPSNNTIDNCILTGVVTIQTSDYPAVIMNQTSEVQTNNIISNCTIENGSYGIHYECDNGTQWTGFEITDNTFTDQRGHAMYLEDIDAIEISGNDISTTSGYSSYNGIYLNDCDGDHTITGNSIESAGSGTQYAIYLSGSIGSHDISGNYVYTTGSSVIDYGLYLTSSGATGSNGRISNNSIQVENGSSGAYALYLTSSTKLDVLQNTLYISGGTSTVAYPFYSLNSSNAAALRNNVFVNEATATGTTANHAIYMSSTTSFNSGISDNAYYTANTGSPFRGRFGSQYDDFASYLTATGETGSPQNVDPSMTFIGGVGWKATESSLTNGAPQLSGIALDIDGLSRYDPTTIGAHENGTGTTPPVADFSASATATCTGTTITFTDASTNTPTSWAWSFSPASVTYVGATSSSSQNPQVQFTASGLYEVTLTATNADGSDDEVKTDYIAVGLSGTYTIGGTTPDYTDFTEAVTELNAVGVCGPVVFDVRTGTYTEQISIDQFTGSSATNTVTFQSETGTNTDVTLDFPSSNVFGDPNYVVQFNSCDYVTFQNMTIERTGSNNYSRVIDVSGDASYNTITGNILNGRVSTPSSAYSDVVFSDDANTGNTNNTVSNNTITGGYTGVNWIGSSSLTESDLTISGNTFSCYRYGIYLQYVDDVIITQNTITNPASFNSASTQGIYAFGVDGMLTITYNNIVLKSGTNVYGMELLSCVGNGANVGLIANNMVSVGSSQSESSSGAGDGTGTTEGIYMNATTYKNFYYNSFLSTSTNPTTGRAFYLNGPSGANIALRNNIFAQNGGGFAFYNSITTAISTTDHNDFYSPSGLFAHWGSDVANLAALQAASGQDANSAEVDPGFVSNTDLHVGAGSGIDALATVLSITDDIDGDTRDVSTPDIGADEYNNTLPVVTLDADVNTGTEAATTVITLTVTATTAVTGDQTVDLAITGTGITAGDYTLSGTTITILNGQTTGSVTFTVVDDANGEGTEIATATISNPSAGIVIGSGGDTEDLTIIDNDICGFETFVNSSNTGSYSTFGWTGDNGVDWTATDARGDQDLGADEAVMLRTGSLTNDVSVAGGCGIISFDYAQIFSGSSTLKVFINGTQYGGDITVSSTTPATFSTTVNVAGPIDIEIQNSGNRTLIANLEWGCYASSNTVTTSTVSSPPYALTSCSDTETGTVDFTSTGTFNSGNTYSVELSDGAGDFGSAMTIGSLSSTANSGTINITIPAGMDAGTGYKVRVVSSNPSVTGTESSAFTITTTCVPATLEPGDLAILAFNTNVDGSFGYDELSFVSFIPIQPGTVLDFTDNAYEKCGTTNGWGISEGWFRLTRTTSTLPAGEVVTVRVEYGDAIVVAPDADWSISKPQPTGQGNFDLNADGEQVFLLSGGSVGGPGSSSPTSDAGTYSGDFLYGFNTQGNVWTPICGDASAGGTKNSAKPIDFDCFLVWPTSQADKNKYTGPLTPASQREWLYRINSSSNWTGYANNTSYEAGTDFKDYNGPGLGRTLSIISNGFTPGLWTGDDDTNWNNCRNWQSLRVPDLDTDVTVPVTSNNPHINTAESGICKTIDIQSDSGAKLYIDGTATFQVTGP